MSRVVSLRLKHAQMDRLLRAARRLGRTPSEAAALLLEEALRQREFAFIEFRDSPVGRQAYLQGTRLPVWQVVWLVRSFGGDLARTAAYLEIPVVQVTAAMRYAEAHAEEVEAALADSARAREELPNRIPTVTAYEVDAPPA